ncbi:MAG: polyphenol oxidase family protein [Nocardioides sp.]
MFAYREHWTVDPGTIEVAFSDSSMDFGDQQGGSARSAAVARVAAISGARPVLMRQVHGARVRVVDGGPLGTGLPVVDGLVTARARVAVVVRVADCVPVLLADPVARVVGVAHAGRVGLTAGIVAATVREMRGLGADRIRSWIGPHICGGCYEVPDRMREEVANVVPAAYSVTTWGTPALDVGAGVIAQLEELGCVHTRLLADSCCTYEGSTWHSYRRDGHSAGRMAGMIWLT